MSIFAEKLCSQHAIQLPTDLQQQLMRAQNTDLNSQQTWFRFMNDIEIEEIFNILSEIEVYDGILPLWADDQSNYVGIHYKGPFAYRVCHISHEETDLSPGFRNVTSFLSAIEEAPDAEWEELVREYPSHSPISGEELEQDLQSIASVQQWLTQDSIDEDMRCQRIFGLMALTPSTHMEFIRSFVDDEDMYVQERAQELIKFHRATKRM
ncbi:hypothetical protein D3C77_349950 [compost metagenome]